MPMFSASLPAPSPAWRGGFIFIKRATALLYTHLTKRPTQVPSCVLHALQEDTGKTWIPAFAVMVKSVFAGNGWVPPFGKGAKGDFARVHAGSHKGWPKHLDGREYLSPCPLSSVERGIIQSRGVSPLSDSPMFSFACLHHWMTRLDQASWMPSASPVWLGSRTSSSRSSERLSNSCMKRHCRRKSRMVSRAPP